MYVCLFDTGTQLIHKAQPKRHKNFREEKKLKPTECANPLNALNDQNHRSNLTSILMRGIRNGVKDEPHNGTIKGNSYHSFH